MLSSCIGVQGEPCAVIYGDLCAAPMEQECAKCTRKKEMICRVDDMQN